MSPGGPAAMAEPESKPRLCGIHVLFPGTFLLVPHLTFPLRPIQKPPPTPPHPPAVCDPFHPLLRRKTVPPPDFIPRSG